MEWLSFSYSLAAFGVLAYISHGVYCHWIAQTPTSALSQGYHYTLKAERLGCKHDLAFAAIIIGFSSSIEVKPVEVDIVTDALEVGLVRKRLMRGIILSLQLCTSY